MSYLEAVVLGLVQGLGEFLPISSSAHLVIAPWLFDFKDPGLTFDIALHFGTLIALLAYFWRDWWNLTAGFYRTLMKKPQGTIDQLNFKLAWYLVLATIPGAIAGLLLDDFAESYFRNPLLIAFNMALLGAVLFIADKKGKEGLGLDKITLKQSLVIGLFQGLALIPGVSRSGITMTMGLFCGLSRETSARFSFLLAAPIILGACVLKAPDFFNHSVNAQAFVGILVSAVVGFLAIKYLMRFVREYGYKPYVYYRFIFAFVVITVYFTFK